MEQQLPHQVVVAVVAAQLMPDLQVVPVVVEQHATLQQEVRQILHQFQVLQVTQMQALLEILLPPVVAVVVQAQAAQTAMVEME
jgi:hypothetical protein